MLSSNGEVRRRSRQVSSRRDYRPDDVNVARIEGKPSHGVSRLRPYGTLIIPNCTVLMRTVPIPTPTAVHRLPAAAGDRAGLGGQ